MVCEMLIKIILGQELGQKHILLKPSLIVRETSGKKQ